MLIQQGLNRHVEALSRYWGCPHPSCARHDPKNSPFVFLPVGDGSRLVCEQHNLDMVDLGPRPRVAQLKVMQNGLERHRSTVIQDEPLFVGRFPGATDLSPFLDETSRRYVSRADLRSTSTPPG